jgi:hypothetical protein
MEDPLPPVCLAPERRSICGSLLPPKGKQACSLQKYQKLAHSVTNSCAQRRSHQEEFFNYHLSIINGQFSEKRPLIDDK